MLRHAVKDKHKIGFCLDTCHAFAAGYSWATPESYHNFLQEIEKTIGLSQLKLIHLNDSKGKANSRIDRHADIGEGSLGLEAFQRILNDSSLQNIPKIIETPKKNLEDDLRNLEILRSLLL